MDVDLEGVEGDALGVVGDVEVNDDGAVKGELVKVGLESHMVVARDDVGGEQLAALDVDSTCHIGSGTVSSAHGVAAVRTVADGGGTGADWDGAGGAGCRGRSMVRSERGERGRGGGVVLLVVVVPGGG